MGRNQKPCKRARIGPGPSCFKVVPFENKIKKKAKRVSNQAEPRLSNEFQVKPWQPLIACDDSQQGLSSDSDDDVVVQTMDRYVHQEVDDASNIRSLNVRGSNVRYSSNIQINESYEKEIRREYTEVPSKKDQDDFCWFESHKSDLLVLVMKPETSLAFVGAGMIRVLSGVIKVMSHEINANQVEYLPIYGPTSHPYPVVTSEESPKNCRLSMNTLKMHLHCLLTPQSQLIQTICSVIDKNSTVVLIKPLFPQYNSGVLEINRLFIFPTELRASEQAMFNRLKFTLCRASQLKNCLESDHYGDILTGAKIVAKEAKDKDSKPPIILVCGPQSYGKSTLLRLLSNAIHGVSGQVLYLDMDPGQSEFTPSGGISMNLINQPILGPSFTHPQKPIIACYTGGKTVDTPTLYTKCLDHIMRECKDKLKDTPLLVNTMGWTRSLGISLLVDTIRLTKPTCIVQFIDQTGEMPDLDKDYILSACGWATRRDSINTWNMNDLVFLPLPNGRKCTSRMYQKLMRKMSLLRYFDAFRKNRGLFLEPFPLSEIIPFCIPFKSVALGSVLENCDSYQLLRTLNCRLVALCTVPTEYMMSDSQPAMPMIVKHDSVNVCHGYGIVRKVDFSERKIYLICPLNLAELQKVNALLLGNDDEMPLNFLTNQSSQNEIPYLAKISNDDTFFLYRGAQNPKK